MSSGACQSGADTAACGAAGKNASLRRLPDNWVTSPTAGQAGEGFTMTYAADERVDAYIDALPDWQQAIC